MMLRRHLLNMARYELHCCYHLDELKLLMSLLVMGQFLKSKGPESLWDIFANFLTIDPPERVPGAMLDPPFVFISVTITPIHNLASPNHIQTRLLQLLLHQLLLLKAFNPPLLQPLKKNIPRPLCIPVPNKLLLRPLSSPRRCDS